MTVAVAVTVVTVIVAATAAMATTPTYSSFECDMHGDGANYRTCEFRNICVDSAGAGWVYHQDPQTLPAPLLSTNIARLGPASQSMFRVSVDASSPVPDDAKPGKVAVAFCGASPTYTRWLMDDLFGTFWLLDHHGVLGAAATAVPLKDITFVQSCGRSARPEYLAHLHGLFTANTLQTLKDARGMCFERVVVGPAGHHLIGSPGKNKVPVSADDATRFRNYMRAVAHAHVAGSGDVPRDKVSFVQRRDNRIVRNAFDLVDALGQASNSVEIVFLEDLTLGAQIDLVSQTRVLVAVHGGALANMLFLDPGAAIVELFPFGYHSTLYKDIAMQLGIKYAEWRNPDRAKAVFHERYLDEFGVVGAERLAARTGNEFNEDSMSLLALSYWANQDTVVDAHAVVAAVNTVITKAPFVANTSPDIVPNDDNDDDVKLEL